MNTKDTPNYFSKMSYLHDFGCMCWDDKFLDKEEIKDRCHCPDLVKRSCLALYDMLKWDYYNKEQIVQNYIKIAKGDITRILFPNEINGED